MQSLDQLPLSIARHAIQFIWQTTLTSNKQNIIGLLGSQNHKTIDIATHTPLNECSQGLSAEDVRSITNTASPVNETLKHIFQTWEHSDTQLWGIYQCHQPIAKNMRNTEKFLFQHVKQNKNTPFIHLYIHFDIKGVLESQAWILHNNQAVQIPILLREDGQLATKS